MALENIDYYRTRAEKERALAEACTDVSARRAHLQMAERYERMARGEPIRLNIVERG